MCDRQATFSTEGLSGPRPRQDRWRRCSRRQISRKVRQPGVRRWLSAQDVTVATASLCTTFVIGIALRASHSPATLSVLLLAALASSCAMVLGLEVLNSSRRSNGRKNVLVVGEELA